MNNYTNVTEQDLNNSGNLEDQQKNQKATEIKNRLLKQTHDKKFAENLEP